MRTKPVIVKNPLLLLLALLTVSSSLSAQEYSYTQYNIKEGLAGSTVYCSLQDKDGFMWFGTETGLSRFDGSHFKNFTTADGLTDNEILKMFCDSKGRIWLSLFKKDICYYYHGKIYNKYNDSVLQKLHLDDIAWQVSEDGHGNILIMEQKKLHKIEPSGKITDITKVNGRPFRLCIAISESADGNFWVLDTDTLFEMRQDNSFSVFRSIFIKAPIIPHVKLTKKVFVWRENYSQFKIASLIDGHEQTHHLQSSVISFDVMNDSIVSTNTINGSWIYNINHPDSLPPHILPGKLTSSFYLDSENNFWYSTVGAGAFRVNTLDFRNLFFFSKNGQKLGIFSILSFHGKLFAGANNDYIYTWNAHNPANKKDLLITGVEERNRIIALSTFSHNRILAGSDVSINELDKNLESDKLRFLITTVKSFYKINDDSFIVANRNSLLLFNPTTFQITDTLSKERTTTVFYENDSIYAGTLDGLIIIDKNKHAYSPGEINPILKNKITGITRSSDGTVWLATAGAGIVGYSKGKVVANVTEKNGLTSNICRCIYAVNNTIWVGTDKGLNKISLSQKPYQIIKITSADALASDIINTIYVDDGIVYVGTPEGITYFNAKKIVSYSRCDLRITEMIIGNDTLHSLADNFNLDRKNDNISFEFSGISFKSSGSINYYYRLKGLDTGWQTTTQNFINYTTLPSGNYTFQLRAVNKFGVESQLININFKVPQTLWEKFWFKLLLAAFLILFVWLIVRMRFRLLNKRNEEKLVTMQHMNELEQMALKSQMNPHFIFNSLNSIQQYVMDKDVEGANKFITGFSRLIRKTLDFSTKQRISIAEEIEYLCTYLDLERERLINKFSYEIHYDDNIRPNDVFIPPMILQPYVENSIRHGLRYRNDHCGKIIINVKKENSALSIILEDNGVGRKMAAKYKSENKIQYQSKGMSLTAKRIEMMNREAEEKMKIQIEDLEKNGIAEGTRVTLTFPLYEDEQ